jgi:hypothetical protein
MAEEAVMSGFSPIGTCRHSSGFETTPFGGLGTVRTAREGPATAGRGPISKFPSRSELLFAVLMGPGWSI